MTRGDADDFRVSVEFEAPYASEVGTWTSGYAFRWDGSANWRIYVHSDGRWRLVLRASDGKDDFRANGWLTNLSIRPGERNRITVHARGDREALFVNGDQIPEFDLLGGPQGGSLAAAIGIETGTVVDGYTTKSGGFTHGSGKTA